MPKKKGTQKKDKVEEPKEEVPELPEVVDILVKETPKKIFGNKTPKSITVKFLGGNIRHSGRTQADYQFTGGVPVLITDPVDVKFFLLKAENNPETWRVE